MSSAPTRHVPLANNLTEAMRIAQESHSARLRVALPATIVTYDSTTHLASVQPALMRGKTKLPVIPNVPVEHPRCGAAAIYLPLAPGDVVTLLFSDRTLDNWKYGTGNPTEPKPLRMHDLSDCWAFPGGYPVGIPAAQLYPDALEIWLRPGTKIAITNGAVELLNILDQIVEVLESATGVLFQISVHTHAAGTVPPPDNAAAFVALQALLTTLQVSLNSLKA